MIRALFFFLIVFVLGLGFAFLADMPGEVVVTVAGMQITVTLINAVAALVALVVAVMLVWWLIRVIITSPMRARKYMQGRKRDRGYKALSTGILAAGAGDPEETRRMVRKAETLLPKEKEPLLSLLEAQAALLENRNEDARATFEAMLDDPATRALGLRGLYMEAERLGDREAQKHYAEKATELAPQLGWAGTAAIELKAATSDWEGAIRVLDGQKARNQITKEDAKRKRAVLLTAMARDLIDAEPGRAKSAALEAHKLAPDFAPAAILCAEAALRNDDTRKAAKVLEETWRKATHPDVAIAYVNARPGDSAVDRLERARRLEKLRPNTTDSHLIVARMALEAGEFEAARTAVAAVLRQEPRESAYILMADIEAAETGSEGKVREWLSRAVRAPRDPAWTADGYVSRTWMPYSPVTGDLDAFEWRVPVEQFGGPLLENDLDPMVRGTAPALSEPISDAAGAGALGGAAVAAGEPDMATAPVVIDADADEPVETVVPDTRPQTATAEALDVDAAATETRSDAAEQQPVTEAMPTSDDTAADEDVREHVAPVAEASGASPAETEPVEADDADSTVLRMPDDPGVPDDAETATPKKRFGLF